MKKSLNELSGSLSQSELNTLKSIYDYRCLTVQQIYQLHYRELATVEQSIAEGACLSGIKKMLDYQLIKTVEYKGDQVVHFLTVDGIEMVRHSFELPTNIYDSKKKVVRRGYYRASELDIYPKHINHQVHLNQFVIDFQTKELDYNWKYYDEKYVSNYTHIRPDGLLSILDTDFFLEMDMSTESKKQLCEKWENYRNFLLSREYAYREKKIVVLFIVDGTEKLQQRINLVKHTIYERLLDSLDSEFEIYIGTSEQLLSLLEKRLLPISKGIVPNPIKLVKEVFERVHGFKMVEGENFKREFNGVKYGFYASKQVDGRIVYENNRFQEFLVDDYFSESPTIVSKISYHDKNNTFFVQKHGREMAYLIVAKNEEQAYKDLRMIDAIGLPNIFFTTYQRLKERPFHEALFQYDLLGNMNHFTNSGLEERVYEDSFSDQIVKR
jgi:hypothetical protein